MRIAVLGATSQIAKDLVWSFAAQNRHDLVLFARRKDAVSKWLASVNLADRYMVADFAGFSTDEHFDAIINFVGVGDPAQAVAMGAIIFDITLQYDELALNYLRKRPECRYLFLSSGAAYGASFDAPVDENTKAVFSINKLEPQNWYAVAKLHAECRHRSLTQLQIVDIRVFNYFSHTQDMEARFLITDIVRAIRDKIVLKTSTAHLVRDYLHPSDFYGLVNAILTAQATNLVVDCYSKAPVEKFVLLEALQQRFGLKYEVVQTDEGINSTGSKQYYYSLNRQAELFGYSPCMPSLEGIIFEIEILLKNYQFNRI
jgi:nucleoside-diphosphate-sugar epimerase